MIASDPAATLRELARCLVPGGLVLTAVWASPERNPWFAVPRAAVAARLGDERGAFAGAFGRLGAPEVAADAHREAGLDVVDARVLRETVRVPSGAEHWRAMVRENGHFRRLEAEPRRRRPRGRRSRRSPSGSSPTATATSSSSDARWCSSARCGA